MLNLSLVVYLVQMIMTFINDLFIKLIIAHDLKRLEKVQIYFLFFDVTS